MISPPKSRQRDQIRLAFAAYLDAAHQWNHDPSRLHADALRRAIAKLHEATHPGRSWDASDVVTCVIPDCALGVTRWA